MQDASVTLSVTQLSATVFRYKCTSYQW